MKNILLSCGIALLIIVPTCCTKKIVTSNIPPAPRVVHNAHLPEGWYTHDPIKLNAEIDSYFACAAKEFTVAAAADRVRALIVPHAGHYYSGLCAASAYQTLFEKKLTPTESEIKPCKQIKNNSIKRVIILAPSHFAMLHGIALPPYTVYKTALGEISVDQDALNILACSGQFRVVPEAHQPEHSLEIQLPFLQKTVESFQLVPLVIGRILEENYVGILKQLRKIIDETTLVVVSSDFVHHGADYDYKIFDTTIADNIRQLDSMALQAIFAQSFEHFSRYLQETSATICGRDPIKLLLALLESETIKQVTPKLCCYYTSAHMEQARGAGSGNIINVNRLTEPLLDAHIQHSVSYAGIVFAQEHKQDSAAAHSLTGYEKKALLACARQTLKNVVKPSDQQLEDHLLRPIISPGAVQQSGAFVTLNAKDGSLRGCIGRITTPDPLFQTVMAMSYAAACLDTRFKPVQEHEVNNLVIDISILTPPHPVQSYQDIVIGTHGIILNKLDQTGVKMDSAVFLPQVPVEWKWDLQTTLEQLAQKSGLGKDGWKENCNFEVFEGFEIKE